MATVSIVMPAFNSAEFIQDSIGSVIAQTFSDWELIVVDDKSTDNTVTVVSEFAKADPRVQLIVFTENQGPGPARNAAIEKASGRYIAFLDSDDLWEPKKLEMQIQFMTDKNIALSYTAYRKVNETGDLGDTIFFDAPRTDYNSLLNRCVIQNSSAMYDVSKLGKVFMPAIRRRQDYALYLKILKLTPVALGLSQPLMGYRIRAGSVSSNKFKNIKFQWYIYRTSEKLGLARSLYQMANWAVYGSRKYLRF